MRLVASILLLATFGCEPGRVPGEPVECHCPKCEAKR